MKQIKYLALGFLFFCQPGLSQLVEEINYTPPCDHEPMRFQELEPVWSRLIIDSTFIEFRDSNARYQPYYKDGMEQLSFDGGSFINDGSLYSITEIVYDLDLAGYYIEKIDLQSGEVMWKIRTDLRYVDFREKVLRFEVKDEEFVMYGIRCIVPDSSLYTHSFLLGGRVDAVFFQRHYDIETGKVKGYYTIDPEDPDVYIIHHWNTNNFLFKTGIDSFDYLQRATSRIGGDHYARIQLTDYGLSKTAKDTVISSSFNDLDLSTARFFSGRKIVRDAEGYFYYLNQVLYEEETEERHHMTKLIKLDQNYNIIKTFDFDKLELSTYSNIGILHITEDGKILLRGCMDSDIFLPCRYFYLLFDTELNHLNTFRPRLDNSYFSFSYDTEIVQQDNSILAIDRLTKVPGNSYFVFYRLQGGEAHDTVAQLTIEHLDWGAWINRAFQLDDGDLLLKFNYGCLDDKGRFGSWNPTWMRLDSKDLQLTTTTEHIPLTETKSIAYPNPVSDILNVAFENTFSGQLNIFDLTGRLVLKRNLYNSRKLTLNLDGYHPGHYILQLDEQGSGSRYVRFVKL